VQDYSREKCLVEMLVGSPGSPDYASFTGISTIIHMKIKHCTKASSKQPCTIASLKIDSETTAVISTGK